MPCIRYLCCRKGVALPAELQQVGEGVGNVERGGGGGGESGGGGDVEWGGGEGGGGRGI